MLIAGHEREFWEFWIRAETWNPTAITAEAIDEWIARLMSPGGLRGVLETYRAAFKNGRINEELGKTRLTLPVLTVGAPEFFGPMVKEQMLKVADRVDRAEVFEECGHSLALEADQRLASLLCEFMLSQ
jgi:pimeloyl-ACP methyl ester carboxylesterase